MEPVASLPLPPALFPYLPVPTESFIFIQFNFVSEHIHPSQFFAKGVKMDFARLIVYYN
jgi:hypothetical protein